MHAILNEQNARWWVVRLGIFQLILALIILLAFSSCKGGGQQSSTSMEENSQQADQTDTSGKVFLVDTDYVHIAGHHPEEVKGMLKKLEDRNFEKGTLGHQLLDYLKRGENDLGVEFKFIDLQFKDRTAEINPKFEHEMSDLAEILTAFPKLRIKLMAYTDNVGDEKANEKLTEKRSENIRSVLVEKGISPDRVEVYGYGEKFPVGDNKTHEGRLINNRVEMMVLAK